MCWGVRDLDAVTGGVLGCVGVLEGTLGSRGLGHNHMTCVGLHEGAGDLACQNHGVPGLIQVM